MTHWRNRLLHRSTPSKRIPRHRRIGSLMAIAAFLSGLFIFVAHRQWLLLLDFHDKEEPPSFMFKEQTNDVEALMDPLHSPYLTKYSMALGTDQFPAPKFHGCTDHGFCNFSNVCFSQHDGMMIFDVPDPSTNQSSVDWNTIDAIFYSLRPNRRPWLVPYEKYRTLKNVHFADKVFTMNCNHQGSTSVNPAHFLMGHGKLFVASSDFYSNPPLHFDLLLYHQCMLPHWSWADRISNLLWEHAFSRGVVRAPRDQVSMYLPFEGLNNSRSFRHGTQGKNTDDIVICGTEVYQEPFSRGHYLGSNPPSVVHEWQKLVESKFPSRRERLQCTRRLRIAVWKRTEGSALRHLVNMDDIKRVASEFSDIPLDVVSLNAKSTFMEQVSLFQSFDILITSHGSQLANMIFSRSVAFIEADSVLCNRDFQRNGNSFSEKFILSLGHLPHNNTRLVDIMERCNSDKNFLCPRRELVQADLIVNTTILRNNLQEVISVLCPETH